MVDHLANGKRQRVALTSTSQSALLLVAEVADWRPVVRRKTYCFFLWSSQMSSYLRATRDKTVPTDGPLCRGNYLKLVPDCNGLAVGIAERAAHRFNQSGVIS
ncbi:hypothetical protein EYF80_048497 [Liparis tanakae]|uniref:Uncharacterized protein n=1 Tax=Liparis tanakae TaxID=230148 RepID=A0A4Z2FKQ9_9TELE|nr:hypothetical protein EYF80_048497 [Liparis tanakae]